MSDKEVVRKAIVDWDGNNILASVVQSTTDPTKYGLVICNPDGTPITWWWWDLTNYYTKTEIDQKQNLYIQNTVPTVTVPSLWIDTTGWNYSFNLVTP